MYRLDNWVNEGSAWRIEYTDGEYINICIYNPLSGSAYIELPDQLKNSMKGLFNIKSNDNKYFLWCYIRHLNPLNKNPQRITKVDKTMANNLDCKKDYKKIEKKSNICINVFCYENNLVYSVYISKQKFKDCMDLSLINDENKSHYVYIKHFKKFMFNKTKNKSKKHFCRYCLQFFSSEKVLQEHREICLEINGKKSLELKSGTIRFKNCFKQIAIPF